MPNKKAKLEPTKLMGNAKASPAKAKQPGPVFVPDAVPGSIPDLTPTQQPENVQVKSKPVRPVYDPETQNLFEAPDGEFMLGEKDVDRVFYRKMGIWINLAR